ncbi:MAG: sigma-54-dependent Fis family transcriptional regulator [Bdellovibrionaceae bacterium]|nr:sigma-54-dependent Fis family transcriptional regulator [Bdellovibrionales bacterium]MCB9253605.1 sigma-54-dependent Fis family transcriptional regulator [Pseudobdellovibrionaceae bacterium]
MVLKRVLVIDDEQNILVTLQGSLEDEGYMVDTAPDAQRGLERVQRFAPDVVLLDIWLPDQDGVEVLEKIKRLDPTIEVVMMSGHGTIETAVKAIKMGAFDFMEKPIHFDKLSVLLRHAFELKELKSENRYLREELEEEEELIVLSKPMQKLVKLIQSTGPSNAWVLITGEYGTGKELIARSMHQNSERGAKRFLSLRGTRLDTDTLDGLLLGDSGLLAKADGGTVYFDEVGDLDLETQTRLLELLSTSLFDIRVIGSTSKDLGAMVREGSFHNELYCRLNVIPIRMPRLRERMEDIPALVERFLERYSGGKKRGLSEASMRFLLSYPWPGNVRELKNWIERACILSKSEILDLVGVDGPAEAELDGLSYEGDSLRLARAAFERHFIMKMLSKNAGNISKTAQSIGLERSYLHKKIKTYGIEL